MVINGVTIRDTKKEMSEVIQCILKDKHVVKFSVEEVNG